MFFLFKIRLSGCDKKYQQSFKNMILITFYVTIEP